MIRTFLTVAIPLGLTACSCIAPPAENATGGPEALLQEVRRIAPNVSGGYFGGWRFVVPTDEEAREIRARFPNVSVISIEAPSPPADH